MSEERYKFIGDLAMVAYSQKISISFSALKQVLVDNGYRKYGNNRAVARGVSAAYRYWKEKDPVVPSAIAHTYRDAAGNLAWYNY